MTPDAKQTAAFDLPNAREPRTRKRWYGVLYIQVLIAVALGILLGVFDPTLAAAMKPFGDGFIKLIRMVIALIVFFTVANGIGGMRNMKKVGRLGARALIYFEVVSTFALMIGLVTANWLRPGDGFNVNPATLDAKAVMAYAGQAKQQGVVEFLLHIIPDTVIGAFAAGDILPVIVIALVFGCALSVLPEERSAPIVKMFDGLSQVVFGMVNILMRFAPLGAFGSMAFTIGRYGIASLGPLAKLIGTFYLTSAVFVFVVLGLIAWACGFSVIRFLIYIREEILIVLGTSSSDPVLPTLMKKLENLGCSKSLVGLVVPTGYTFNTDGSGIYMTMATLFIAQATHIELTLTQQLTVLAVAMLTSKGASGVQGASFIALVATLAVIPAIPVSGMALILGIDRFMSEARALVNVIGNGVATLVMARWEGELSGPELKRNLEAASAQST
jgi:aerobic C4-dicarboxylate transport protein